MVSDLLKYWKLLAIVALLAVIFAAWHFDRAEKYQRGRDAMAAEISNRLKDGYIEQAKTAREAEQKAAAALADRQTKLEKEKENAKQTVTAMRFELDRLQQYAKHQSSVRNMPATATTAAASDGAADSYGWQLFGKCAAEYAGLAETADGQAADLKEWQAYGQTVIEQSK